MFKKINGDDDEWFSSVKHLLFGWLARILEFWISNHNSSCKLASHCVTLPLMSLHPIRFIRTYGSMYHFSYSMIVRQVT